MVGGGAEGGSGGGVGVSSSLPGDPRISTMAPLTVDPCTIGSFHPMQRLRTTTVLCLLGLSVCGKASTSSSPKEGHRPRTIEKPQRTEVVPSHDRASKSVEEQIEVKQEHSSASSALEYFQDDLDTTSEQLAPFAEGAKDPYSHVESLKETYRRLHPLDGYLAYYLKEHRDELSEDTREAIRKIRVSASALDTILLAENSTDQEMLDNFIHNTLSSIEEIKPILQELEPPDDSHE